MRLNAQASRTRWKRVPPWPCPIITTGNGASCPSLGFGVMHVNGTRWGSTSMSPVARSTRHHSSVSSKPSSSRSGMKYGVVKTPVTISSA